MIVEDETLSILEKITKTEHKQQQQINPDKDLQENKSKDIEKKLLLFVEEENPKFEENKENLVSEKP